jgi:beta-carotene 15,15'-dioxygenase
MDLELLFASVLVCIFGLPHGALDPILAYRLRVFTTLRGGITFHIVYLLICGLGLRLWFYAPLTSLWVFIGYSALHFGRDWSAIALGGLPYGLLVLGSPMLFHGEEVRGIFEIITFGGDGSSLVALMSFSPMTMLWVLIKRPVRASQLWSEVIGLLVLSYLLNPLTYFLLYFCGLHSPKHLFKEYLALHNSQRRVALGVMLVITSLTVVLVATFGFTVREEISSWDHFAYQSIFIGLAVLTVPHMLLIEALQAQPRS